MKLKEPTQRRPRLRADELLDREGPTSEVFRLEEYLLPQDEIEILREIGLRGDVPQQTENKLYLRLLDQTLFERLNLTQSWQDAESYLKEIEYEIVGEHRLGSVSSWMICAAYARYVFPEKADQILNPEVMKLEIDQFVSTIDDKYVFALLKPEQKDQAGITDDWAKTAVDELLEKGISDTDFKVARVICLLFPAERLRLQALLPKLKQDVKSTLKRLHANPSLHRSGLYLYVLDDLSLIRLISAHTVEVRQHGIIKIEDAPPQIKTQVDLPERSTF